MIRAAAILFGSVFLVVGILGFTPATTSNEMLVGILHVNLVHNIIHLVSGAIFLFCGLAGPQSPHRFGTWIWGLKTASS
jgi:Domain of unknown function (DUF4383)